MNQYRSILLAGDSPQDGVIPASSGDERDLVVSYRQCVNPYVVKPARYVAERTLAGNLKGGSWSSLM